MVTCQICKAQFVGEGTQGNGCACSVYEKDGAWWVAGHYGSRLFDTNRYKFVGDGDTWLPNPTTPLNPVCDVCVSVWLRIESIVWVKDGIL